MEGTEVQRFVYLAVKILNLSIYGVGYHTPDVLANESNPITKWVMTRAFLNFGDIVNNYSTKLAIRSNSWDVIAFDNVPTL